VQKYWQEITLKEREYKTKLDYYFDMIMVKRFVTIAGLLDCLKGNKLCKDVEVKLSTQVVAR
jgi:hypothetical protein